MSQLSLLQQEESSDKVSLAQSIADLQEEIRTLYLEDGTPWVLGYSGGKDSSATLQLVWTALAKLPRADIKKPVHVISTDTLVENPVVAAWVGKSLEQMGVAADKQGMPIKPHKLTPELLDSFWVCLIGKGYCSPRMPGMRWCTERLKIKPSNKFITNVVSRHGEAILCLGTRKAESASRRRTMEAAEKGRIRDRLSPNKSLPGSWVYSPIEDWSNDDVWTFLFQVPNPWGWHNRALFRMYAAGSDSGECPLVVDTGTPSCGSSRFGCWVCTLVEKDKSMAAMIQHDTEKEWMEPLLGLRDDLAMQKDRHLRDFRRMNGRVQLFHDRTIPGPYTQQARADWLRKLLRTQREVSEYAPAGERLELISMDELREIRRIWVLDKHEIEDLLPGIYEQEIGHPYPDRDILGPVDIPFEKDALGLLKECCSDPMEYERIRNLLHVEASYRTSVRRAGLYDALENVLVRTKYVNEEDALAYLREVNQIREQAQLGLLGTNIHEVEEYEEA